MTAPNAGIPRPILLAAALAALLALSLSASVASAFTEPGITGKVTDFANCPVNVLVPTGEFAKCAHSYTTGGYVQIGHSSVPISVPGDTFDLGLTSEEEPTPVCTLFGGGECAVSPAHGLLNGPPQPVPGGLLGTIGNIQLTNVSAKLEWATPVPGDTSFGTITQCGSNPLVTFDLCKLIGAKAGTAATLRVKIHLLSPFLGPSCFIGSASNPIVISLTAGLTSPPPPALPIRGRVYEILVLKNSAIQLFGLVLVNNSFSVPVASGCGTSSGNLINASIDHKLGLPSAAGQNSIKVEAIGEELGSKDILEQGWTGE